MATLQWGAIHDLVTARQGHACCAVRGTLVVLGGVTSAYDRTSRLEMLSSEEGAFVDLPALSCGGISSAAAIAVEESESVAGQVLLLGGWMQVGGRVSTVHLVDLATGVCTPGRPDMLRSRFLFAAAGLPGVLGCRVGRSCAREDTAVAIYRRRRCGGRRCRERRTQCGHGDNCPR